MHTAKRIALPAHLAAYRWRPARLEDIPAVCAMLAAGREVDRPLSLPSEQRWAHLYHLLGERLALLDGHMYVAHRRTGLVSALLAHSLRAYRQAGFSHAALDVDAENPTGALRLYQKLGFCAIRQEIHFVKRLG